jgi:4a-hydroxytetrahydrobiopterin dehydratase
MPSRTPLDAGAIDAALGDLDGWSREGNVIRKTYRFDDFRGSIAFIVRVAFEAEALDHHPEIINMYDRVTMTLSTHDAGDVVTEMDLELARRFEAVAN